MDTYFKFLYEFLSQFFKGFLIILTAIVEGIKELFDFKTYIDIINNYKADLQVAEWVLVAVAVFVVLLFFAAFVFFFYFVIRKYIKFRKTVVEQEELLEEVAVLNNEVANLVQEKQEILAMKVSKLGL